MTAIISVIAAFTGSTVLFLSAILIYRERLIKPYIPMFLLLWGCAFILDGLYHLSFEPLIATAFYSLGFFAFIFIAKSIAHPLRSQTRDTGVALFRNSRFRLDPVSFITFYAAFMGIASFLPGVVSSETSIADWYLFGVLGFFVCYYPVFSWVFWKYWRLKNKILNAPLVASHKTEITFFIVGVFSFPVVLVFEYGGVVLPEGSVDVLIVILTIIIITPAISFAERRTFFDRFFWTFSNRAQLELLKTAIQQSSEGMAIADMTNRAVFVNSSWARMHGHQQRELIGKNMSVVYSPERMKEIEEAEKSLLVKGSWMGEINHLRRDGVAFPTLTTISSLRNVRGQPVATLSISRDITERQQMEKTLRETNERLMMLMRTASEGITTVDSDENVTFANKAFAEMVGYGEDELVGMNLREFSNEEEFEKIKRQTSVRMKGETSRYELTLHRKDGESRNVQISASPLWGEDGSFAGALSIVMDVTERKQMLKKLEEYSQCLEGLVEERTKQLKEAQEKLLKSERLAAIGELAAMVGHDLRNPLTGIAGATYYLKTKYAPKMNAKGREMLSIIEKDIEHSNKIINDLLDYSREIRLELAKSNPKAMITDALSLIAIPKNVQIVDLTEDEPTTRIDIEKIKRAFVNIIKNAVEAMPKGGTLTITSRKTNGILEVTFTDTGMGMSKKVMERIGTPLFTTKAKGMGFGLALCKRIVEAHSGHMSVESAIGKGTTFTVTLPLANKSEGGEKVWLNAPESSLSTTTKA